MARKLTAFLLVLLTAFPLASCAPKRTRYEAEFLTLFDTVTKITGYAESREEFTAWSQRIHDELETYHRLYDIYNDYDGVANIKTINDRAGGDPVQTDRRIIELLVFAREMYGLTGGKVNVAMGSVLSLWHDYREAGIDDPAHASLPPREALEEAARHMDITQLIIDEDASTVRLADPDMRLDVGAVAKGYAVEQVARSMEAEGFSSGLLSVGGNVRAIGSKEGGPWKVGLQDPADPDKLLETLSLTDTSLVTSGTYQRYYTVEGRRYHHIIDPETLMPADYYAAVSILCPDSGKADALSTAVFNMPLEEGRALVESMPDAEALWVYPDGRQSRTPGFR